MKYIDGFVLPVPKGKLAEYKKIATKAGKIWVEHGALEYIEAVLDDPNAPDMVAFPKLAQAGKNETVILAYIVYKSRTHRDKVNAKVMADERIKATCGSAMPFDCSKMAYGGFQAIVQK